MARLRLDRESYHNFEGPTVQIFGTFEEIIHRSTSGIDTPCSKGIRSVVGRQVTIDSFKYFPTKSMSCLRASKLLVNTGHVLIKKERTEMRARDLQRGIPFPASSTAQVLDRLSKELSEDHVFVDK